MIVAIIVLLIANIAVSGGVVVSPAEVGVAVSEDFNLSGATAFVDSYRSTNNVYAPLSAASESIITVNSVTANSVTLFNDAVVNGDLYVGPGADVDRVIKVWDDTAITGEVGTLEEEIVLANISVPDSEPFNQMPEGDFYLSYDQAVVDYDLHVDDFVLVDGSVVTIDGNVVIVVDGDFDVSADSYLKITDGSTLDLYVYGDCYVAGRVNSEMADPQAMYWFMLSNNAVFQMVDNAAVFSVLQNPAGSVNIAEQSRFFGRIKAKSVKSMGGIHIDLDSGFPTSEGNGGEIVLASFENEELIADSIYEITWNTNGGVGNVIIEYSVDGGYYWEEIDTVTNIGSYEWYVPNENSQECFVRVLDAGDSSNGAVSEEFTIYVCDLLYDLNGDCKVDVKDAEIMAEEWMKCGNPFDPDCDK